MPSEAEILRDDLRGRSIGPIGSAVVLGPTGPEVYFKVRWTDELVRVIDCLAHDESLDSTTQWIYLNTEPTYSCALTVEWPAIGVEVVLFFDLPKWRSELEILRMVSDHVIVLVKEQWNL